MAMLDYYLFKQVHELFLMGKAEEARNILADLQEKYIEISDENALLKTQIQEFEDILYLAKNLEYDGRSYWLKTGSIKQGPFCQTCFDKDGLLIRLEENESAWRCSACGSRYAQREVTHEEPRAGKVIHLYK